MQEKPLTQFPGSTLASRSAAAREYKREKKLFDDPSLMTNKVLAE